MTNATIVLPVATTTTAAVQESFKNDSLQLANSLQLGSTNNLSFIEQLIIEQEVWSDTAFKTSNEMLYGLLAKCQAKYEEMCADDEQGKKLRGELNDYIKLHNIAVNKNSHTVIKIVKCVFGDTDKRRISTYGIVLRTALANGLKANQVAAFIKDNGGVQEIKLARGNALTTKAKAVAVQTFLAKKVLAEVTSPKIAETLDASKVGQQVVFVATQKANGKFVINAVTNSTGAVNTALAACYTANKAKVGNNNTEKKAANKEAAINNAIKQALAA